MSRQYYWRCDGLVLLAKLRSASPICCDNAYLKSYSKRKRKYWVLHRNGTFKFKITPDRHNAGQKLIYCLLPSPHFSLPTTFKRLQNRARFPLFCTQEFREKSINVLTSIEHRSTEPQLCWAGTKNSWQVNKVLDLGTLPTSSGTHRANVFSVTVTNMYSTGDA
jgi:hypothetical protein